MRPLFQLSLNGDVVNDITFISHPLPASDIGLGTGDHTDLAGQIAADRGEIASIIVVTDRLEPYLWDDPAFASWTASVGACEARVAARRRLLNERFGPAQLAARAAELGFPLRGTSDERDVDGYRSSVLDAVYEEHELLEMLAVLDEERAECCVDWVDDEPRELDEATATQRWQIRLRELVAPRPLIDHKRRYDLPSPLEYWDPRNAVQQWYFTFGAGRLEHRVGGSASSGQRESHGRWAHTFATLATSHGLTAPTLVLRYDSRNALRLVRDSPTLLVHAHDLVGNYRVDHDVSRALISRFTIDGFRLRHSS